ncbi:hypothetical protein [Paraburkholderia pallida]|uniref:Uncharacterized protein n=1 Tax=Paraburkholderia pallida TaxID=2547399 RepID=A0A4P7CKT3_9BURK|nr:hypothetical protein [Paraburkholderia pallida]QBQ96298.1 hypothetical protein E1956_03330 [Paraburkholderia pallida]
MSNPNIKAKEAYSRFDTSEHEVLSLIRAILHTAARGLDPDGAHQVADEGAFGVIYGLADLAEKLLKRDLHRAVADLRAADAPCRLHSIEDCLQVKGAKRG